MTLETFVVTGGAQGIGAGVVARLIDDGHRVVVLDLIPPREETLTGADGRLTFIKTDLASSEATRAAAREALSTLGHVYGLVHCAAYMPVIPFAQLSDDDWNGTLNVNVSSAFALAQELAPSMRAHGSGRIVLFASSQLFAPAPDMIHYVASKGAVTGLVRSLSHALGPDFITVNAVAPGLTATEAAVTNIPQELFDHVVAGQAIPRTGQVSDQVGAVIFLLSADASFITGQTILVDGGESHL